MKIRCDACPVMCFIADGKSGACDRYANQSGNLIRVDPLTIIESTEQKLVPFMKDGSPEDWDGNIIKGDRTFITAVGAGTTYPDYKPAPFIVSQEVDGVDMVTIANYLRLVLAFVLPFAWIVTANSILGVSLYRAYRRRQATLGGHLPSHTSTSVMLMAVCVTFLLLTGPFSVYGIIATLWNTDIIENSPYNDMMTDVIFYISHTLCASNSAINIYLYCVAGRKFRRALCGLFRACQILPPPLGIPMVPIRSP